MGAEYIVNSIKEELKPHSSGSNRVSDLSPKPESDLDDPTVICGDPVQGDQINADSSCKHKKKVKRCLRHRRSIDYGTFDVTSDEGSGCEKAVKGQLSKHSQCPKVTARWNPGDACRPVIDDAPVFYPTDQEFKDTLGYIESIQPRAEPYGICRIVPPSSWKPPCPLKEKRIWEKARFGTRVQQIDMLQNREPIRRKSRNRSQRKRKRRWTRMGMVRYGNSDTSEANESVLSDTDEKFGFHSGADFTLQAFQNYADDFEEQYFGNRDAIGDANLHQTKRWKPSMEDIEGEYWRIIEKSAEDVQVLYGADLETGVFGSGFPRSLKSAENGAHNYVTSGWNLNNFSRLPGSVLCFEKEDISGVLVPWLYIGMCFSSFCWHVEDHHLYSLNYLHFGEPKLWYGIPGSSASLLEGAMRKHLPRLFEEQPDLLHELVTQLSPSVLKSEGVPVYRVLQQAGEFVLTFPRAYHSGFNCGFNCAEAVNVAPFDWLPHGQCAVELYSQQGRKTSLSHDRLLLEAARSASQALFELLILNKETSETLRWKKVCGIDGVLTNAIKLRIAMERDRRRLLPVDQTRKMDKSFDSTSERECFSCYYDLHLSAAGCGCSPQRFACLKHSDCLCSCESDCSFFLFRYELDELDMLLKALEGEITAVRQWASMDQSLFLDSTIDESENSPVPFPVSGDDLQSVGLLNDVNTGRSDRNKECTPEVTGGRDSQSASDDMMGIALDISESFMPCYQDSSVMNQLNLKRLVSLQEDQVWKVGNETSKLRPPAVQLEEASCNCWSSGDDNVILVGKSVSFDLNLDLEMLSTKHTNFSTTLVKQNELISAIPTETGTIPQVQSRLEDELIKESDCPSISNCNVGILPIYQAPKLPCSSINFFTKCPDIASCSSDPRNPSTSGGKKLFGVEICDSQGTIHSHVDASHVLDYFVEPLNLGKVMPGKKWCSSRTIFPKGYKSRASFISVLDPTRLCNYISEVLDAGLFGPLFKVTVEESPNEAFVHESATSCWDMVLERLNQELIKHHNLGKNRLPLLQPPENLDGLEMFGFLSPPIIQAIEALDPYHCCTEYWMKKFGGQQKSMESSDLNKSWMENALLSGSRDVAEMLLVQADCSSRGFQKLFGVDLMNKEMDKSGTDLGKAGAEIRAIMDGLLKKATKEELYMMHKIFCSGFESTEWRVAFAAVMDEMGKSDGQLY